MKRREEEAFQITFIDKSGEFKQPEFLYLNVPKGQEFIKFLETRDIWNKRIKGLGIYWNPERDNNSIMIFNPSNWQIIESVEKDIVGKRYFSLLIIMPEGKPFNESTFADKIRLLACLLKEGSPCYVLERRSEGIENSQRLSLLKTAGLTRRKIIEKNIPEYIVWEGRTRSASKREPVDLTDENKYPRGYAYSRKLWSEMTLRYKEQGFIVIDPGKSDILNSLKASKNPVYDWRLLEQGHGVIVKNIYCGCTVKVLLNGDQEFIWHCPNEDPGHLVMKKEEPPIKESELDISCFDCGFKIHQRVEIVRGKEITTRYCTHCGWDIKI